MFNIEEYTSIITAQTQEIRQKGTRHSLSITKLSSIAFVEEKEMGIVSEAGDIWATSRRNKILIAAPAEDHKAMAAGDCVQEGVRAGLKAAAIACVASAVPTLTAVRTIPWAKANLNYTGQALVISAATIAAYFITVDKTILECARRNAQYDRRA